ncbi:hypothetical protein KY321_02740, partial [Candidatus Woesearchaeota archaeon]|nr:hypothetical protein [Candidatus Woesearchaeota archaeon]
MKFNWKKYINSRPDLSKKWNTSFKAKLHYYTFRKIDLLKKQIHKFYRKTIYSINSKKYLPKEK